MKTELKAKYFAGYLGQHVVVHPCDNCNFKLTEISLIDGEIGLWGDWSGGTNPELSCNDLVGIDLVHLELRSIDSLTDGEKSDIVNIIYPGLESSNIGLFVKSILNDLKGNLGLGSMRYETCMCVIEYLRSISIALPLFDPSTNTLIPVEKLVEEGVIKLKS